MYDGYVDGCVMEVCVYTMVFCSRRWWHTVLLHDTVDDDDDKNQHKCFMISYKMSSLVYQFLFCLF